MAELKDWNIAAGSNTSAPPNGWPEGMSFANVNNTARENMAVIARWFADNNGSLVSTGSANAYLLAANRVVTAYAAGDTYLFKASFTNTGAVTVNVDSVGAQAIVHPNGSALSAGRIVSGGEYLIVYDGTNFQLVGAPNVFESSEISLTANTASSASHLLGGFPTSLMAVLRCKTTDLGYAVDAEIPLASVYGSHLIVAYATATTVAWNLNEGTVETFDLQLTYNSGVVGRHLDSLTLSRWRLVIRASRI